MFERFTDRARRVTIGAQEAARELRAPRIEPEHLLIAIAADPEADGAAILSKLDVGAAKFSGDLTASSTKGLLRNYGHIRFAEETKRALKTALSESTALDETEITTGHLLLCLLASEPNKAADALSGAGVQIDALRAAVRETQSNELWERPAPPEPHAEEG
jgi:ATP-dependent Clp protease ATP-binding subunit ClpA